MIKEYTIVKEDYAQKNLVNEKTFIIHVDIDITNKRNGHTYWLVVKWIILLLKIKNWLFVLPKKIDCSFIIKKNGAPKISFWTHYSVQISFVRKIRNRRET